MQVIDSAGAFDIKEVVSRRIEAFQHIKTNGYYSHENVLRNFPCTYEALVCSGPEGCVVLPVVHRSISLLKISLMRTYFGVVPKYLQLYLVDFISKGYLV